MRPAKATIKRINGEYYLCVPEVIVEIMGWHENDTLLVPFHELQKEKLPSTEREEKTEEEHKNEVTVKLRNYDPLTITRNDIINLLENPTPDIHNFRTAYIIWKNQKFGSKAICKKLFGHGDFTTIEGEWYLRQLGFKAHRTYE